MASIQRRLRQQAHFHVEVLRDIHPSPQGFQPLRLPTTNPQATYLASMPFPIFVANETVTSIRTQLASTDAAELDRLVYTASLYYKHGMVVKMLARDEHITPDRPDGVLIVILRPDVGLTHAELIRLFGQQMFDNLLVGGFSQTIQRADDERETIRRWNEFAAGVGAARQDNMPTRSGPGPTTTAAGGTLPTAPSITAPTYGDIHTYLNRGREQGGGAAPGPAPRPGGLQPAAPPFVPGGPSPGTPGGRGRGAGGRGRAGSGEGRGGPGGPGGA